MQKRMITSIITFLLCLMVAVNVGAEAYTLIGGSMQSAHGMHVSFSSKVSVVQGTDKFLYWYRISNPGLTTVLVQWELLARASSGRYNFPTLVFLDPGASKEFWLQTKESPKEIDGRAYVFQEIGDEYTKLERDDYGFWGQRQDEWVMMMGSSMPGFIPEAWLKPFN